MGDDVYISFSGGDPNHPIIEGSAFNEANRSKVDKEENKTVHTFYTVGKNGFAFEDKDGAQCLDIVAEKDLKITAKDTINVESQHCTFKIKENATFTVENNELALTVTNGQITIKAKTKITVEAADISIKAEQSLMLEGSNVTIKGKSNSMTIS